MRAATAGAGVSYGWTNLVLSAEWLILHSPPECLLLGCCVRYCGAAGYPLLEVRPDL
jgi:hypothetical protein